MLCNAGRKAKISTILLGYIAFPFALVASAIMFSNSPRVLGWGGGVIELLVKTVSFGLI